MSVAFYTTYTAGVIVKQQWKLLVPPFSVTMGPDVLFNTLFSRKRKKGHYWKSVSQATRIVDQMTRSFSFERQCLTSQSCRNRESLELLGLVNSSTSIIQSWFGAVRPPKNEKAPQRSALPLKKWLRAQEEFLFYEELDKSIYRCGKCLKRLGDNVDK
jgi:hypothetical protein